MDNFFKKTWFFWLIVPIALFFSYSCNQKKKSPESDSTIIRAKESRFNLDATKYIKPGELIRYLNLASKVVPF